MRTIKRVVPAVDAMEGAGVPIHRVFPTQHIEDVDPFLLLDHMGPTEIPAGSDLGFPAHPHRGFETVTYLLEGQFEHRDSFGHRGLIEPGDVQWMTAGSGLVHSEMPGPKVRREGGRLQGFQLWVNLPRRAKAAAPRYQELKSSQIPSAVSPDGKVTVKVIAGEALGAHAVIGTNSPITFLHFTLEPGAEVAQDIPKAQNTFAYAIRGTTNFGGAGSLAVFGQDGDSVLLKNEGPDTADVLVVAGEPLGEPVARYGPFVMNTKEELYQAFADFRAGKMGYLD